MQDVTTTTSGSEREWIATQQTFIKVSKIHSDQLGADDKMKIAAGKRLVARQTGTAAEFIITADGLIGGEPVPIRLKFIHSGHWKLAPPDAGNIKIWITEDQLLGARWSFGPWGEAPISKTFYFGRNGKIRSFANQNEEFWSLENNELLLLDSSGRPSWRFICVGAEGGRLQLAGFPRNGVRTRCFMLQQLPALLASAETPIATAPEATTDTSAADDRIKLIIWDLDDTFWTGTVAEGGISPITAHIELVKVLATRGIVSSICSKNHFEATKQKLVELDVWDYFIFPRIEFAPKGTMIRDIIAAAQLRASSVLFLDDNPVNINEALHYNSGLQTGEPADIAALLDDPRCKGKPDPELRRLANYKVLESKAADRMSADSDNLDFLRNSGIVISFHHIVGDQFARIHDLVNRTNQLNFTKKRWPEDETEALEVFQREQDPAKNFNSHWGYVKVADKYGGYGICGFYLVRQGVAYHFLFSCRTLNMGIEQFVWEKIGRPRLQIVGEVVSDLGDVPDWITVVDDADAPQGGYAGKKQVICVRGACDLAMMNHYLRIRFETIEEFPFPYQDWEIHPSARVIAVYDQIKTPAGRNLIAKMPGIPPRRFESAVNTGEADIYLLSFSPEMFCGLYRSKSTCIELALNHQVFCRRDFKSVDYAKIKEKVRGVTYDAATWKFMQDEFEYTGLLDTAKLSADVEMIFSKLRGKTVIVLMLSTKVGSDKWALSQYVKINSVVRPLVQSFGYHSIDLNELIRDENDLVNPKDGGVHFKREIYRQMADRVQAILSLHSLGATPQTQTAA